MILQNDKIPNIVSWIGIGKPLDGLEIVRMLNCRLLNFKVLTPEY